MKEITQLHHSLKDHKLYTSLNSIEDIKVFMKWHIFAVWDFMSLLKSLQKEITCVSLPWRPSKYPADLVRFVNEIVVGEECDEDGKGGYLDHYSLYIEAMKELGVDHGPIESFIEDLDFESIPEPVARFVSYNLNLSLNSAPHNVAAAFFWGRENIIPDLFEPITEKIKEHGLDCPKLLYYLERHIELDGDEHGDLANKCFELLCDGDSEKLEEGHNTAICSLRLRSQMWDFILEEINKNNNLVKGSGASISLN